IKYLLIIILIAFVVALVYVRLRPYIRLARRAFGFVREARRMTTSDAAAAPRRTRAAGGEKLVRCASCDTWLPASRALTFRASPDTYCSQACLERAGRGEDRAPRAARKL
ncbi:MAG: hypothetical protein LC800_15365, partial [Acidobacteria bacterium]|nr:hypothetical protein [Acidobacteriota bacterium]